LSECYGSWKSVYSRFCKWRNEGVLERACQALSSNADRENFSIDSTCVKVHQSANGGKKSKNKAIGLTRGGINNKIHAVVNGLGNPVQYLLSSGNDHDSINAIKLLDKVDLLDSHVLADRAYGTAEICD